MIPDDDLAELRKAFEQLGKAIQLEFYIHGMTSPLPSFLILVKLDQVFHSLGQPSTLGMLEGGHYDRNDIKSIHG